MPFLVVDGAWNISSGTYSHLKRGIPESTAGAASGCELLVAPSGVPDVVAALRGGERVRGPNSPMGLAVVWEADHYIPARG